MARDPEFYWCLPAPPVVRRDSDNNALDVAHAMWLVSIASHKFRGPSLAERSA
jgi:hypothetical protein